MKLVEEAEKTDRGWTYKQIKLLIDKEKIVKQINIFELIGGKNNVKNK